MSRIYSNATKFGRPYLDRMEKVCSALRHSPLYNLKCRGIAFTPGIIVLFFPKIVQIQYFLAHCAVNLSFMVLFTCVVYNFDTYYWTSLNLEAVFIQIGYFDYTLNFYKFQKFLNSYLKEDAVFQNPIHVWLLSKDFTYFY